MDINRNRYFSLILNSLTPTYQPSAQDIANGSVTLILSAESNLGCGSFSDEMVIYINQNPELDFTWEGLVRW
jgi:hypothetical protein